MNALAALTERVVISTIRDLDLLFAILAPVVTFIGLTFILRNVIDTGGMSYPQYVLPAIVIQAMVFSSMTTADRAARDQASGFGVRLRTMPMSAAVPLMARMLYCLLRGILGLVASLAVAYVFGFRMSGGWLYAVVFVVIALVLTIALSLGADATGTRLSHMEASSQVLLFPQLMLVLLSTGLAPLDSFPDWVQPFVQYQPVSQVAETLRGLSTGHVAAGNMAATLAWCIGLFAVFGFVALRMQRRPR
ncbi:transport permease protein [Mycolicibacterium litorale]|uniref:Transport permease protein n=1 Tax=Mycolicibacterium litorale TaxID=758802 RepID=A0A6S6P8H9_9MYCO|nr:ABC transporter permease [Mycolicibacterium litorale]BCI53787.1 transport permease protein [Mycolicibacterium litorale]